MTAPVGTHEDDRIAKLSDLVASGRWSEERGAQMAADLTACGPPALVD